MGKQAIPGLSEQLLLFRKAGDLDVVDAVHLLFTALTQDTVTLYSLAGDLCSEASVDRKFQQPLVALHFVEGSLEASTCTFEEGNVGPIFRARWLDGTAKTGKELDKDQVPVKAKPQVPGQLGSDAWEGKTLAEKSPDKTRDEGAGDDAWADFFNAPRQREAREEPQRGARERPGFDREVFFGQQRFDRGPRRRGFGVDDEALSHCMARLLRYPEKHGVDVDEEGFVEMLLLLEHPDLRGAQLQHVRRVAIESTSRRWASVSRCESCSRRMARWSNWCGRPTSTWRIDLVRPEGGDSSMRTRGVQRLQSQWRAAGWRDALCAYPPGVAGGAL
ncbi:unnamed protein product [Effrenium voratum]|nr:unnamed protein product [Effrenium voratum]